eukprot:6734180-Pyramimonas_sp.AAC.1
MRRRRVMMLCWPRSNATLSAPPAARVVHSFRKPARPSWFRLLAALRADSSQASAHSFTHGFLVSCSPVPVAYYSVSRAGSFLLACRHDWVIRRLAATLDFLSLPMAWDTTCTQSAGAEAGRHSSPWGMRRSKTRMRR